MFIGNGKADVEVHDTIVLQLEHKSNVRRRYTFTCDDPRPTTISWLGTDRSHGPCTRIEIASGNAEVLSIDSSAVEWQLRTTTLEPGASIQVELEFAECEHLSLDPLEITLSYVPTVRSSYSFEIHAPWDCCFDGAALQATETSPTPRGGWSARVSGDGIVTGHPSVQVSPNAIGSFAAHISQPADSPPITRLMRLYSKPREGASLALGNCAVLLIPHLLKDAFGYVRALEAHGMSPDSCCIVGIPYSTKFETAAALWQHGYKNIWTPANYPFDDDVHLAIRRLLQIADEEGKDILVVEDGGYAGPLLHRSFETDLSRCRGIVEQTRNGIWRYTEESIAPQVPVLNVAECDLKLRRESPLIGAAVVFNVQGLLAQLGYGIENYRALVVGFGSTGSQVASVLRKRDIDVRVFDADPSRRKTATDAGFESAEDLASLVPERSLIIGCTGAATAPFNFAELSALRHDAVFVNASSKRRELNYDDLDSLIDNDVEPEVVPGVGTRYTLLNGRALFLLANGYPVNFVGESVPDEDISFITALLHQGAVTLASDGTSLDPGFHDVPEDLQREIEERHKGLLP